MKIESVKGKSPYAKRDKSPFKYGDLYHKWAKALNDHGPSSEETIEADAAFRKSFGIPLRFKRGAEGGHAIYG